MFVRWLCVALPLACVFAQTPVPASQKGGTIRGSVVGPNGEPLRKADVTLRAAGRAGAGMGSGPRAMPQANESPSSWSFTTDASGAFSFAGVPAGRYVLSVRRNGYVQRDSAARQTSEPFEIADGGVQSKTLRMVPHGVISGTVLDEDGEPVVYASIQVMRETWAGGKRQTAPVSGAATNDLGQYRVHGLPPGRYLLLVTANRGMDPMRQRVRNAADADVGYAPVYYPGVVDAAQAAPIVLAPGQEMRGADVQLRKQAVFRVRGRVVDENGAPATQVAVMAMPEGAGFAAVRGTGVVRGPEGIFEVAGLAPGSYLLFANRQARNQERTFARASVQVGSRDLDGVVLQMQKTFPVSGTLRMPEGVVTSGSMRVMLNPESGLPFGAPPATVDASGVWKAEGLVAGQYRISLSGAPEGTYLKSVAVQGQDITEGAQISGPSSQIQITLGANAPQVGGAVLDRSKQPAGESIVVLVPEPSRRAQTWRYRTTVSDASGNFAFRNLAPGQYTVVALPKDTEDGSWFNPDWMKTLEGSGASLKLEEKSAETVQVTLAQ